MKGITPSPSPAVVQGDTADVYFLRSREVMERQGLNPRATMEVFPSREGLLCGMGEVMALLREALPNILLMDVHVQGQHTIDLVRQMRQSDESVAHIPVVMTSAMDCRRECIEAGANQFILKPFLPDEVVEEVADLSRQQRFKVTYDVPSGLAFRQ